MLRNLHSYHYCKEVAIDDIFLQKPDAIVLAFDRLLQALADWEEVEISATKNCVVFFRNKTFLVVKPLTKCLEIKFYAKEPIEDDELHKCRLWNSKYEGVIRVSHEGQLHQKYFQYIKNSYLIS
ncbi:DUF5655 domain-containing protein [Cytophagales bacterium LB-30]|uniref:DUF5655 domain-containing protein n=1 Tax=Shiella aurantiaca TaxID=3058365 RepID=A0ABT8F4Z6_9BACT|nr:DUF5655 domain-containing protein [Shiella aurantiaca]MDN4165532.1 DUF5655 domain-containing protein [Shiella aurantiaca]